MKKTKFITFIALFAMLLCFLPSTAKASDVYDEIAKDGVGFMDKLLIYTGEYPIYTGFAKMKGVKDLKISSSNKAVCEARYGKDEYAGKCIILNCKKPGKAEIKVSYKFRGKKYKSKARIKVTSYSNPFKSFSVGGKEERSIFNESKVKKDSYTCFGGKKFTGKKALKVTLKKGYKLSTKYSSYQMTNGKPDWKFKNGKKVNFSKMDFIGIAFSDKEGYKGEAIFCNQNR